MSCVTCNLKYLALTSWEEGQVITTDAQVRKLMSELRQGETLEVAGLRSGMGRKTAGKYARLSKLPSELKVGRGWMRWLGARCA